MRKWEDEIIGRKENERMRRRELEKRVNEKMGR